MAFRRRPRPARTDRPHEARPDVAPRSRRVLPAVALGAVALAAVSSTALPAAAAPTTPRLTPAAKAAGLEPGNATMGWHARATAAGSRSVRGSARTSPDLSARSTAPGFVPKGVLGIDVASYQRTVSWSTWAGRGKRFAYVKATEGTSYRNPYFSSQFRGAKKALKVRGAYHFGRPDGKVAHLQAQYFVRNGGRWTADGRTLPGVLDIEYNPYGSTCYGLSKKQMVGWINSFTKEYRRLTGKAAVIYSTTDWWRTCTGNTPRFGRTNPLWLARYGTTTPGTLPKGWTSATFWQYAATSIDSDVYRGHLTQLRVLATKQ